MSCVVVLLRRGHSDWSASSGQPSYYFLWPAASGRARTECDIVLISLCWKKRMHLALKRSQYLIPQTFLCIMCALYLIFAWFSSCHFGLQYVAPISSPIVKWTAAALSAGALFFHWFILIFGRGTLKTQSSLEPELNSLWYPMGILTKYQNFAMSFSRWTLWYRYS